MSHNACQHPTHFPSIHNLRADRKGWKLATFDVQFGSGLTVCDVSLHQHASGKRWIAWPGAEYIKIDGSRGFRSLIKFRDQYSKDKLAQIVLERAVSIMETK